MINGIRQTIFLSQQLQTPSETVLADSIHEGPNTLAEEIVFMSVYSTLGVVTPTRCLKSTPLEMATKIWNHPAETSPIEDIVPTAITKMSSSFV